jgi:N-acetylneuraminate synthase
MNFAQNILVKDQVEKQIGLDQPPFIIAEMSGNHNQSLDRALAIVDAAAAAGAHALKLQTYTADTMTIDFDAGDFHITDKASLWTGQSLYKLYEQAHTPWEWHEAIFRRAREHGMIPFSTPFDETAVDFLESLNVGLYKIASFENTHLPLMEKVARTNKPVIVSTGMATLPILEDIITTFRKVGNPQLILLKCTSTYPATPEDSNVKTIPHLREMFGVQVGLSDHTMGLGAAVAAVALGASVIEKHFTLSRAEGGVDSTFSLEPSELKGLVVETTRAWQSLGRVQYTPTEKEQKSMQFRRSIYVIDDIEAGQSFTLKNIKIIRPGFGLPPKYLAQVLNSKAARTLRRGHALNLSDLHSEEK